MSEPSKSKKHSKPQASVYPLDLGDPVEGMEVQDQDTHAQYAWTESGDIDTAAEFEFKLDPIRGCPELRWAGKRPFSRIPYYPAQLKEVHGEAVNGWRNLLYWGDNLQVMSHLLRRFRGRIQLVYIDPPFDSKADYKKRIELRGAELTNDRTGFEEKQYSDIWTNDEYLQFLYERLVLIRELLTPTGSAVVHCDWRVSAFVRLIMDEVFGPKCFRNTIVWTYSDSARGAKAKAKQFARNHDDIIWYSKGSETKDLKPWVFNPARMVREYTVDEARKNSFQFDDNAKVWFKTAPRGDYTDASIEELRSQGRIHQTRTGGIRIKYPLEFRNGKVIENIIAGDSWSDIPDIMHVSDEEKTDYPTQKPEALLRRIVESCSNSGDLIADFFAGSGTTLAVAKQLGRKFVGADCNLGAIQTMLTRLLKHSDEDTTGFELHTVNHYEVFRNPLEAKDLLIEALGIESISGDGLWDGEFEGRVVKIMPINRIATREDLNELVSNFDYKAFDRQLAQAPNRPVLKLQLVCMGHEPDLKAQLQRAVGKDYPLDIEIVDILRDKEDLQFKRDSEAAVVCTNREVVIEAFYPMNLLQKLSLERTEVGDWKELVDCVMVDFDYDGSVLRPSIRDLPEGSGLVKGRYPIPDGAGAIRVKITDLLSDVLEIDVERTGGDRDT